MTAAAYTHTHAHTGRLADRPVWFSSVGLHLKRHQGEARNTRGREVVTSQPSLSGVGVTGVQAGLCGRGGAAVMGSWWTMKGLCAPPQVLQGLQEGATRPLLLQWRGAFLLHLCNLGEGDRLCFESSLTWSAGAALAPGWALRDRQLLGELLHS